MPNKENNKNGNQNDNLDNNTTKQDFDNKELSNGEVLISDDNNKEKIDNPLLNGESIDNSMQGDIILDNENIEDDQEVIEDTLDSTRSRRRNPKKPKNTVYKIFIICLVILASVAAIYLFSFLQNEKYLAAIDYDTYYNGIYVDNIHLGGLTKEQAMSQVSALQKTNEQEIKVTVAWDEEEEFVFYSTDVSISYDSEQILNDAYQVGRSGTNAERYKIVMGLQENNVHYTTSREVDPSPIEDMVRNIAISKAQEVSEPAVEFVPDKDTPKEEWFIYSDPVPGIETDDEALWNSVVNEFEAETYGVVPVPKWEIKPDEEIDLREITQQIISFKTTQARNSNREHNIALASSMINGTVLMPGEEFSMNNTTGERTKEKGFKEANTIVGGNELVPGIAGGVCQVSGTLFNAALMADLEITERYHHSFELGYLTRGRDATVNYGTADLKFMNNHDYPVYIAMYTDGLKVYAEIYGAPLTNCDYISIWVKTKKTIPVGDPIYVKDSTVPAGSEPKLLKGHKGITCEVYKIYKDQDGKQLASELLYTDVYKYYAPELHVNPADYEGYINPTPVPATPTPAPTDDDATG